MSQSFPALHDIKASIGTASVFPVARELMGDFDTPTALFSRIRHHRYSFLLESITGGENLARFSFIGYDPSTVLRIRANHVIVEEKGTRRGFDHPDPLALLNEMTSAFRGNAYPSLPPFYAGAVGFFSYDAIRYIESIPDKNRSDFDSEDIFYVFADKLIVFDHVENKILLIRTMRLDGTKIDDLYARAERDLDAMEKDLSAPVKAMPRLLPRGTKDIPVTSNFTKEEFCAQVTRAKEYIYRGDIFQVQLSQRFSCPQKKIDTLAIYRALRLVNPSPYMFCLSFDDMTLIGSSPEILVKQTNGVVALRPIAGTRRRGKDAAEDAALAAELISDTKELAEHLMLIDLGRNDVGRIAQFGTVRVTEKNVIERYAHVMHIVSNVQGRLANGKTNIDVIRSAFPAGTVTGAPKVRAMEIIDELENVRRGPYAGSVGYFSASGNMDTGIIIRTIFIKDGTIYFQAAAGIVYDSNPEKEYEETLNKVRSLIKALTLAKEISA